MHTTPNYTHTHTQTRLPELNREAFLCLGAMSVPEWSDVIKIDLAAKIFSDPYHVILVAAVIQGCGAQQRG